MSIDKLLEYAFRSSKKRPISLSGKENENLEKRHKLNFTDLYFKTKHTLVAGTVDFVADAVMKEIEYVTTYITYPPFYIDFTWHKINDDYAKVSCDVMMYGKMNKRSLGPIQINNYEQKQNLLSDLYNFLYDILTVEEVVEDYTYNKYYEEQRYDLVYGTFEKLKKAIHIDDIKSEQYRVDNGLFRIVFTWNVQSDNELFAGYDVFYNEELQEHKMPIQIRNDNEGDALLRGLHKTLDRIKIPIEHMYRGGEAINKVVSYGVYRATTEKTTTDSADSSSIVSLPTYFATSDEWAFHIAQKYVEHNLRNNSNAFSNFSDDMILGYLRRKKGFELKFPNDPLTIALQNYKFTVNEENIHFFRILNVDLNVFKERALQMPLGAWIVISEMPYTETEDAETKTIGYEFKLITLYLEGKRKYELTQIPIEEMQNFTLSVWKQPITLPPNLPSILTDKSFALTSKFKVCQNEYQEIFNLLEDAFEIMERANLNLERSARVWLDKYFQEHPNAFATDETVEKRWKFIQDLVNS